MWTAFPFFIVLIVAAIVAYKELKSLSPFGLMAMSIAVNFGLHGAIESLTSPERYPGVEDCWIVSVYIICFLICTSMIRKVLWKKNLSEVNRFKGEWPPVFVIFCLAATILLNGLILVTLGQVGQFSSTIVAGGKSTMHVILSSANDIFSWAGVLAVSGIILKNKKLPFLVVVLLVGVFATQIFYGRRTFTYLASPLIVASAISVLRGQRSKAGILAAGVIFGVLSFVCLTVYQNLRNIIPEMISNQSDLGDIQMSELFDLKPTIKNISEERTSISSYLTYVVVRTLKSYPSGIGNADQTILSISAAVPKILWSNKPVQKDSGSTLASEFALDSVDYPDSLFELLAFDFGFFSIIPASAIILTLIIITQSLRRENLFEGGIYLLGLAACCQTLVNFEQGLTSYFSILRILVALKLFSYTASLLLPDVLGKRNHNNSFAVRIAK